MAYDPFAPLGLSPGGFGGIPRPRAQRTSPEEEQSLLAQLGSMGMGGINYVAQTLQKPQAALFGLLAGEPEQLANLIPFSDTLGITDPNERYDWRGVMDTWGVSPPNQEGFHPIDNPTDAAWDAVGLAGDIFIDPLIGVGALGKALTPAGKLAEAAGLLDNLRLAKPLAGPTEARMTTTLDELARMAGNTPSGGGVADALLNAAQAMGIGGSPEVDALMSEPVGSLFSYFGHPVGTAQNPLAMKAGQWMDSARKAVKFNPVMRPINSLFSAPVGQADSTIGQDILMPAMFGDREAARSVARGNTARLVSELELSGSPLAEGTEENARLLRRMFENVDPVPQELEKTHAFARNADDDVLADAQDWGVRLNDLQDPEVAHFPRRLTERVPKKGKPIGETQINTARDQSGLHRQEFLVGNKEGTEPIIRLAQDEEINDIIDNAPGLTRDLKRQAIEAVIKERYPEFAGTYTSRKPVNPGEQPLTFDRPSQVANWLMKLSPEVRASGVYGNHPVIDFAAAQSSAKQSVGVAKRLITAVANDDFLLAAERAAKPGSGSMRLGSLFRQVGLNPKRAIEKMAELKQLPTDRATLRNLANKTIPGDIAKDITKYYETFSSPQAADEIGGIFDSITNLYRAGVTSPWPAFHSRNMVSGLFNNWLIGAADPKSYAEAHKLLRGETVDASDIPVVNMELNLRGLQPTPENSTRVLKEILYAEDAAPRHSHYGSASMADDDVLGGQLADITSQRVGEHPFSAKEVVSDYFGQSEGTTLHPLKGSVRGVGGATESTFGPLAGGDKLGSYIEGMNRVGPMISLLRQGVDPAEAARRVGQAQVRYSNRYFTPAEQALARFGFPFYKFSRQMIPFTIQQLAEQPGGKLAKTLQVLDAVRGDLSAAPDYVQETTGISLGEQEDGTSRYITGLGLPFEDTLSFVGGGPKQALLELMSRTNPLVKAPAEWATGQSFFQRGPEGGRPLEDLDPTLGRTISNLLGLEQPVQILGNRTASRAAEAVAANSPLARVFTSARTATDPRKGIGGRLLNLGTGVRISDISPAAEDAVIRERVDQALKEMGAAEFSRVYMPQEELQQLDPMSQLWINELTAQKNTLVDRAKERKRQREQNALPGAGAF